jgi:hypothetical protein
MNLLIQASNRLTIAGQIPLLPRTLTFSEPGDILFDAILALQHVRRIIEVMGDSSKGGAGWVNRGWIEGVVGWYVGGREVERIIRAVWTEFASRVSCVRSTRCTCLLTDETDSLLARMSEDPGNLCRSKRVTEGSVGRMAGHAAYWRSVLACGTSRASCKRR